MAKYKRPKIVKPALTADGEAFRQKLLILQVAAEDAQEALEAHEAQCPHQVYDACDVASCVVCETDFGWYCKKSPDHVCHYFSNPKDHTKVEMIDGSLVDNPQALPDPEDPDWVYSATYENEDECLFCGAPYERK